MNAKDPCPCGSGKRYKHCHGPRNRARRQRAVVALGAVAALVAGAAVGWPALRARLAGKPAPAPVASTVPAATPATPPAAARADAGRQALGEQGADGVV